MVFKYTAFIASLFLFMALPFSAQAQTSTPQRYVDVKLTAEKSIIKPGDTIYIAVEQNIHPGWHTYWINPGDSGEPTSIEWVLPEGFETGPFKFPVPHAVPIGPLVNYGYEKQVISLQELYVPYELPEGPITLNAKISLLVCEEICIPEFSDHSITFNNGEDVSNTEYIDLALEHFPTEIDWNARYQEKDGKLFVSIEAKFPAMLKTIQIETADIMPVEWGVVDYTQPATGQIEGSLLTLQKKRGERPLEELETITALIPYTDIRGEYTALQFTATPDPVWQKSLALQTEAHTEKTASHSTPAPAKISLITALLFAFIGGLILNLMPCVFPVLSMKALSLCQMQDKERKAARYHGLAYMAGILVSFGVIAGLLMSLKAGGEAIGWGFQLQNPMMVLTLSWLFFIIGLSLTGFFSFNLFLGNAGNITREKHGYFGSFLTGILATIVATPCTAPFMGAAMGFAMTQPALIGILVFLSLGMGLSFPYLALSFFPALRSLLPKPGKWMENFQRALSVPMLLSAAWLIWVYNQQAGSWAIAIALGGMAILTAAIWLIKSSKNQKQGNVISTILAGLLCAIAFKAGNTYSSESHTQRTEIIAESSAPFSIAAFDVLLQDHKGPVFVNMTAAWCITCKVNEKLVLSQESIMQLFKEENVRYVTGDWTNQNGDITNYLEHFGRNGVPLYVFYGLRNKDSGKRPDPVILPQILTPGIVTGAIKGETK